MALSRYRSAVATSRMQKRTEDSTVTVPIPDYPEVRICTLQSIIRQSGLPRTLFE